MPIQPVSGEIQAQPLNDNFSYLESKTNNISKGSPSGTYATLAALRAAYPNGNSNTYVVTSDGKWYYWNGTDWTAGGTYQATEIAENSVGFSEVKDNSLNINSVDFIETSKNLFDVSKLQPNGFHNYTTGVWAENSSYDSSGKIPCRPGQQWTSRFARWVCYFDKNGNFLTGGFATGSSDIKITFTIPENVYYFEITCQKINTSKQQIENSSSLSEFEEFSMKIPNLKVEIDPVFDIPVDALLIDKMDFIKQGKNLFNPNKTTKGYYVNPTTGALDESPNYLASALIPTYGKPVALQDVRFYSLYTKDGTYLSGETLSESKVVEASTTHSWIRISPTSGLESAAQVEYGTAITDFEPYTAVLDGVSTENKESSTPLINLPSKIYGTVNKEVNIFQQNVTLNNRNVDFRWGRGIQGKLGYEETFTSPTSTNLSVEVYKEGKLIKSKPVEINIANPRTSNIKVLLLGDSTVASATTEPASEARLGYHIIDEMDENVTLLGTRGLGSSKHEGRGGWTAKDYRSNKTDVTGTNPFYNPTTSDFDFRYYVSQTSSDVPDVVVIQLGINDLFNYTNDETALAKINEFIADISFIADNIKTFNSSIEVVYNLAIPPTEKVDVFAETYQQYNLPQWRYKRNNYLLASEVIKELDNSSTINLNAINKGIDVENNIRDGVHPNDAGYAEIARQIVDCLNNI